MTLDAGTLEALPAETQAGQSIRSLLVQRTALGVLTLVAVSIIVFLATQVLPGNAAYAILGQSATPARVHALELRLGLDQSVTAQYWKWASGLAIGRPGISVANGEPVWAIVRPQLINSAALVFAAGFIATVVGLGMGTYAALRKDRFFDHAASASLLAVTALPEFVVGIGFIILFSTVVLPILPAVSLVPPGTYPWGDPQQLVLPVATLVVVTVPYLFRMMRATMIEALESDYVETARLKGLSEHRVVLVHALPNVIAPAIQVIGLTFLYLAGGIVVVESVFNYPGIGTGLVNAVSNRDIPTIQFIVLLLAMFYISVNIVTDVIALLASPRRRFPRH